MANENEQSHSASKETYLDLARLAHESFEQRRSYEWKMHFGLWAAIAAVVLAATKENIVIFSTPQSASNIGFTLWAIYFLHFIMANKGHWKDKQRKHYYMAKAEGQNGVTLEKYNIKHFFNQTLWAIPYMLFTGTLIYLAIKVLVGIDN